MKTPCVCRCHALLSLTQTHTQTRRKHVAPCCSRSSSALPNRRGGFALHAPSMNRTMARLVRRAGLRICARTCSPNRNPDASSRRCNPNPKTPGLRALSLPSSLPSCRSRPGAGTSVSAPSMVVSKPAARLRTSSGRGFLDSLDSSFFVLWAVDKMG